MLPSFDFLFLVLSIFDFCRSSKSENLGSFGRFRRKSAGVAPSRRGTLFVWFCSIITFGFSVRINDEAVHEEEDVGRPAHLRSV